MQKIRGFFFVLLAVATLMSSRPSQATVGAIIAAPVVVTAGLVATGVGAGITVVSLFTPSTRGSNGFMGIVWGSVITMWGLIILDGEQGVSYSALQAEDATRLGITSEEMKSFNAEIDQVNAVASYVDSEVAQIENATEDDAAAIWSEVKEAVSPETFAAMVKVTAQIVQK